MRLFFQQYNIFPVLEFIFYCITFYKFCHLIFLNNNTINYIYLYNKEIINYTL